jgi:two-component sensor histidine kinase/PAS domain-containing protein
MWIISTIRGHMKKNEEKFESAITNHSLLNINAFGVLLVSSEGVIIDCNRRFSEMINTAVDKLKDASVNSLPYDPQDLKENPFLYNKLKHGEEETSIRKFIPEKNKTLITSMNIFMNADGSFYFLFHDITENRRMEEKLKMKSMFLEAVANSSDDGILVVDLKGKKILQNQRNLDLWKISPEIAEDDDGSKQVDHVIKMTKYPEKFFAEIEYQKKHPYEATLDELELIDGTVLHRHSAPVLGENGKNYGRIYHFHDITSFKKAEEKIRSLLEEKEIILKEVHHRVKNYMSTLIGLLVLQASTLSDDRAIQALDDAKQRLTGMMTLYEKLYVSSSGGSISTKKYLPDLIDEIIANFPENEIVTVKKDIDDIVLDAKTLQTISIITNELLTNIMKYAFIDRSSGNIKIKFKIDKHKILFTIRDDGIGLNENIMKKKTGGFGLMLVRNLVRNLNGEIDFKHDNGTEVIILFDIKKQAI